MAQIGLIRTSSHGTPCLCLHSCRGVFRLLSCRCTYEHVHQTEAMQVCRKAIFSVYVWLQCLCLICGIPVATNPDPSGDYTHSLQTHFQGNEELPCGSWRTQLCKISGNIEHGISNFLIWQVDSNRTKEDCVRQRCKLEIRNIATTATEQRKTV